MKNMRFASNLSLLAVVLSAAWLVFCAVMIGKETLFPHDGLTGFRASDGSLVHVQQGAAVLQSPGTLSDVGAYHLYPVLFGLGIPFVILVGFAVVGCRSLLARKPSDGATA